MLRVIARSSIVIVLCAGAALLGFTAVRDTADEPLACPLAESSIGSFVPVTCGGFFKGAAGIFPEEGQPRHVFVSPFLLQVNEVTSGRFATFVEETGYVTEAEQICGSAQFDEAGSMGSWLSWWKLDATATWRSPAGAGSSVAGKKRHPVIHVILNDARAYAQWAGGRLPTEIEWQYAATLGFVSRDDQNTELCSGDTGPRANTWDGVFPIVITKTDGYAGTAPVGRFEASRIGAYDMIGNVWEWTETRYDGPQPSFTIKGGSYLCSENYCRRDGPAARQGVEPDFSTAYVGWRIVKDAAPVQQRRE